MNTTAQEIIEKLGGTTKTAQFFGVNPGAVSQWRRSGIPASRMQTLKYSHPTLYRQYK